MKTITGKYIKKKPFSNTVILEDIEGKRHEIKTDKYISETLSYFFEEKKVISLALDEKNKAFFMLPASNKFYIASEIEANLKKQCNKELLFNGIPALFMGCLGMLLISTGIIAGISSHNQPIDNIFKLIISCVIISFPAFYMSKKILERFFNIRKIIKNNHLLNKMTNNLNNYKNIILKNKIKEKIF